MALSQQSELFYDISAIKQIPILSAAEQLGISVEKRGRSFWCKVRDEANSSVILHPDKNFFYDFGNQEHGDVIRYVQYVKGISAGAAIRYLGKAFGLKPCMTHQELMNRPLTDWEYEKIGLHGDMTSKNLVFPIETATMDELCELSSYYRKPLKTLCREDPQVYRELIENKAVPYVENLRNCYYLSILNDFQLTYAMGDNSIQLYRSQALEERFQSDTQSLNRVERILSRAYRTAGLEPQEPSQHDPVTALRKILHGEITISLGTADKQALSVLSAKLACSVEQTTIPPHTYFDDRLSNFLYNAEYKAGVITVQYLSADEEVIKPILQELQQSPAPSLRKPINKTNTNESQQVMRTSYAKHHELS